MGGKGGGPSQMTALDIAEEAGTASKAVYIYNELFLRTGVILKSWLGWVWSLGQVGGANKMEPSRFFCCSATLLFSSSGVPETIKYIV